ncbi:MAG: Uma2 family endonuclease [Paracoccaceae bacterium]|nr:Uma2 family endonuclease [Paracoccaceae bacterium]MDE2912441.1 Uma2 family endonuclease [Paracoccaceae bacterium]
MPEYPDAAYFTIAPDWICEVLSPSTRRLDQSEKRDLYAREGVLHLWFVDPDARTLEDFELREGQWLLLATLAGDVPVSHPPFDAITFPLDALWPEVIADAGKANDGP